MRILIINVSLRPYSKEKLFPIGLGYIATAVKNAGYDFELLDIDAYRYSDQEVKDFLSKHQYDVVCMGCIVTGYKIIKELAYLIKGFHPGTKIIAGNSVATSIVNTLLSRTKVDIAVIGEGDETIVELLRNIRRGIPLDSIKGISLLKDGRIISTPKRPPIKNISSLPFINFDLFDVELYIKNSKVSVSDPMPIERDKARALPVNIARGCIANCGFCYHVFKGIPYRYRSPESIADEIKELVKKYSLNYINFWDELTFFSSKHSLDMANKFIAEKLHVYWTGNCRADLFKDDKDIEIVERMKEAGCVGMFYSLETADPVILKAMNKHTTVEQFSRQTSLFHKAKLPVWTSLVFGYPQETPKTIKATFDCCIKNGIYPSVGYLLPQPGSAMYAYAQQHGFIKDEEGYLMIMGDRQDLRLNMTSMPDEEFIAHVMAGLKRCNQELEMGLDEDRLIKTQYFRAKR